MLFQTLMKSLEELITYLLLTATPTTMDMKTILRWLIRILRSNLFSDKFAWEKVKDVFKF